jgi:hypothetical protein
MRRRAVEMNQYGSTRTGSSDEEDESRMLTDSNVSNGTYGWIVWTLFISLCAIGAVVVGSIALDLAVKSTNKLNDQSDDIMWKTLQEQRISEVSTSVKSEASVRSAASVSDASNVVVPTNSSINAISFQRNEDNTAGIYFSPNITAAVFDCGMIATTDNVTSLPVISFVGTVETTSKRTVSRTEHKIMALTMTDDGAPLVGIGVAAPESALDILGDLTMEGILDVTGSFILNGENITQVSGPNGTTIYINNIRSSNDGDITLYNIIVPYANNTIDLGSPTNGFADIYVAGTAYVGTLRGYPASNKRDSGNTISLRDSIIPSASVSIGTVDDYLFKLYAETVFVSNIQSITGTDPLVLASSIIPGSSNSTDLGTQSRAFRYLHVAGNAYIYTLRSYSGSGRIRFDSHLVPVTTNTTTVGTDQLILSNVYSDSVTITNLVAADGNTVVVSNDLSVPSGVLIAPTIDADTINGPVTVVGDLLCDTEKTDYFMWIAAVGKLMIDTSTSTACVVTKSASNGDWNCVFSGSASTNSVYGLTIEIPSRTTAGKGLRIISIGVSYSVATAVTSITSNLTRVTNNNGSARTFTDIPLTGSLTAASNANPYYTTLTVTDTEYDNAVADFYVFELHVATPGSAWNWKLKGINVRYSFNTL